MTDPSIVGDPVSQANALLAKMNTSEKIAMLHGVVKNYVGNVVGNDRLGIPPLNLNDGPQGFRDGGSTAWPSGMTVGVTWDVQLAAEWGRAMGKEFYDKGANVQLGPGVCLARVPKNGRNFEYISGADPYLGYAMVNPVISGIQSQNVIANVKHFAMNNQETNRNSMSSNVDERTRFEMYYPPFEGAVEADVGSAMCSYNKINGVFSCENNETLAVDFKQRLGFQGWVMSDWGATHSASINEGLDQEMPAFVYMNEKNLQAMLADGRVSQAKIDDSVRRMLVPMFKFGTFDHAAQWTNKSAHGADVTSREHSELARNISAAAHVLLQNDGSILPLKPGTTIAVIGDQARKPIVSGGGSGHVTPTYVSSPLEAINTRSFPGGRPSMQCTVNQDVDYFSLGDSGSNATDAAECCAHCFADPSCLFYTFTGAQAHHALGAGANCWHHATMGDALPHKGYTSGGVGKASPSVSFSGSLDHKAAAKAAAAADVAIVFVAATSSEGADRKSLSYEDNADSLVEAVAGAQANTVVVGVNPGAALTPWASRVKGLITAFMPGLEYGHAAADVLFGDVNPSGRLSVSWPNVENEINFTEAQWPGSDFHHESNYSERLLVDYRWYDARSVAPQFPFGHGLSYTSFRYANITVDGMDVSFTLSNVGPVPGAEVAQLYLEFPTSAGEPPRQLKRFAKVFLAANESRHVAFSLRSRDVSVWDVGTHGWVPVTGDFGVAVGASSRDLRLHARLTVGTECCK